MTSADNKGWIHFTGKKTDGSNGQEFKLPSKTALHFRTKGHSAKLYELYAVQSVVAAPKAIFEGLKRDGYEDGLCYCGTPAEKYISDDAKVPSPQGWCFLVFMNKEFVIFEFRWEKMSETDPGYPQNHEIRFERKTWCR